ncbi:hypothetical protein [Paenibacillus allorhizoplanae]|nr:hypothetical protein [Paenibacillus allorhizoplanae]
MPTNVSAHPEVAKAVYEAGGRLGKSGTKPWAYFDGADAEERAKPVIEVFKQIHGYECSDYHANGRDVGYDYAIRLD